MNFKFHVQYFQDMYTQNYSDSMAIKLKWTKATQHTDMCNSIHTYYYVVRG